MATKGLIQRLKDGPVICAEGYLFEMERRGYLQAGAFVPEVVVEYPEVVRQLHRDFAHAGSDVMEAFTYYAHREKMRLIGREDELEAINRQALRIAREVAEEYDCLLAGNICNTNIYEPNNAASADAVRAIFAEQVRWAADEGADYIVAETIAFAGEAAIALDVIGQTGLPAVITLAAHRSSELRDGLTVAEACRMLEKNGADVVGLNCARGPDTMLPLLEEIAAICTVPLAALPVPYRTTAAEPNFQALTDPCHAHPEDERPFPTHLDPMTCTRTEIADFTKRATGIGVSYLGVCCGAGPHHIRAMAEALGRRPPASRYSADMSKHYALGDDPSFKEHNLDYGQKL